jgi:hypothetical protein
VQHPASPAVARPSCQTLGLARIVNGLALPSSCAPVAMPMSSRQAAARSPSSKRSHRLFGVDIEARCKRHGAEAPKNTRQRCFASWTDRSDSKQRHNALVNQAVEQHHNQAMKCEDQFGNAVQFTSIESCVQVSAHRGATWALRNRALTLPSRGRATSGFAGCRPPLMSIVRAQGTHRK